MGWVCFEVLIIIKKKQKSSSVTLNQFNNSVDLFVCIFCKFIPIEFCRNKIKLKFDY